jgi:stage V sporulation protein AD
VTGSGAALVCSAGKGPKVESCTIGTVTDLGIKDANNMGAAMAPAACTTIADFLRDTNTKPEDYDLIITGDLGTLGSRIFKDLIWEKGYDVEKQHVDCGELIYNLCETEYQGGSGAGCSSLVFNSYIYKKLIEKKLNRVVLIATGALLSSLSSQQGDSIPGISHLVVVEA